ncbi:MAG: hypothetical protein ACOC2N_01615 [Spirochaetota bacterium]
MKLSTVSVLALLVPLVVGAPLLAQENPPESISDEMLLEAEGLGERSLLIGTEFDHFDENGYPEDENGRLVLSEHRDGPILSMRGDPDPYLLYAQYVNRQRDAVILARTSTVRDVLPSGNAVEIPFGYGVVRFNDVHVSIVESLLVPHFSDNQKNYVQFPLTDLYLGGSFGLTGVLASLRYVHTERFVGYTAVGYNPFGSANPRSVMNRFIVPIHLGGGYRFPGVLPEILGENNWTLGADLMLGFGDRDDDPATPAGILLPGVFLDVERVLFDESAIRRDFRTDPRPYNYRVNALVFRAAAYINVTDLGSGSFVFPAFSLSYQYNVVGPRIPSHEFKETQVLYVNDVYREDLERQAERRKARNDR